MKQIAVFAPLGRLDQQPGIINAANCFAASGYQVDVFTVRNTYYAEATFPHPNIQVRYFPIRYSQPRESRLLVTLAFTIWMLLMSWRGRHSLIFAGGIRGLISSYVYSLFYRAEIINYQTELYIGQKLDTKAAKLFKAIERRAAQRSLITIEHDEQRCKLLCDDLGVSENNVIIVPNAPLGPARKVSSAYLHNQLDLPPQSKILLNPGTLSEAFASSLAVRSSQNLTDNWNCVVHSAKPLTASDPYLQTLIALNQRQKVVFSLDPVPYERIDELLSSATIGLVLYSDQVGENTSSVGLASGKLSHFLKLGIPVIVSNLPGLSDFVLLHRVGLVLDDYGRLPDLVEQIESDLSEYRNRCISCFNDYLAYEKSFEKVINSTEQRLSNGHRK
jgi:glycosyltransferase involved in cell wall biosynthesis